MQSRVHDRLVSWLRDAHAMEAQAEVMLSSQIRRLQHYPDLKRKLEEHLTETQRQRTLLEDCLSRLGVEESVAKDAMGKMTAFGQGLGGMFASDEVIKGSLASYAFEQMEVAAYTILIAAAEQVGDAATAEICTKIRQEEQAMAEWLAAHMPQVVRAYLQLDETPNIAAKR